MKHHSLVPRTLSLCLAFSIAACAGAPAKEDAGGAITDGKLELKEGGWDGFIQQQHNPDARPQRCDDAGVCRCMNIASLGKPAHYSGTGTDAFQTWLNTKSNANLAMLTNRVTITPELLANYDVVILQALEDSEYNGFWSYSQAEIDALAEWVKEGNGLIALSGYGADPREVTGANQLLAFANISLGTVDTFNSCPDNMCYCHENTVSYSGWTAGSWIATNMLNASGGLGAVGVWWGRPITCSDGPDYPCELVANDAKFGAVGVGKAVGKGRVFVWSDEWVTYSSQWGGGTSQQGAQCDAYLASAIFNCPQFWYNVIHWTLPDASCFAISDPQVIP